MDMEAMVEDTVLQMAPLVVNLAVMFLRRKD